MSSFANPIRHRPQHRVLTGTLIALAAVLAAAPIAYMVWPRAVPVALDAPSLPITVGGVTFNVPPAAIRVAMQRRPGTQGRLDLSYVWPTLTPPDPKAKPDPKERIAGDPAQPIERVFVTIAATDGALSPGERLKVIYPRYTAAHRAGPDGLVRVPFRAGSPYHGEELVYDSASPERFLLRCTATLKATPGMCLHERRVGAADVTIRFPADWLSDWKPVNAGIDRLIASMRPSGT